MVGRIAALPELLRRRLMRFARCLTKVLSEEDADAVHDLRVASRRTQQVMVTMFPKPRVAEAQTIVKALRRARGAVGGWRDCDVLLDLLRRKARRIANPDERRAWDAVGAALTKQRVREIRRARRRLAHHRLFSLSRDVAKLVDAADQHLPAPHRQAATSAALLKPPAALTEAIDGAYRQWRIALELTHANPGPAEVHAFRIQSKRLRYRIELARDLGDDAAKTRLEWLKSLQDELGRLHDRVELGHRAAEVLADPELLLREPQGVARLLRRLAREEQARQSATAQALDNAAAGAAALEAWVMHYCGTEYPPAAVPSAVASIVPAPDRNS